MWNFSDISASRISLYSVPEVILNEAVNQYAAGSQHAARRLAKQHGALLLATGMAYPGAHTQSHPNDSPCARSRRTYFAKDLSRSRFNDANPGWPWLRLSRFGRHALLTTSPYRFHDTNSFLRLVKTDIPDISPEAVTYLEEAVAAFYADCLLACCVMLVDRV